MWPCKSEGHHCDSVSWSYPSSGTGLALPLTCDNLCPLTGVTWCDMVWHSLQFALTVPLAAFPWFQFPHACDVIETRFTLVLAGTIVAALLRFDGHSDLAHLHHRSSHIIISSDIICAYLCISVQSWWPFTAWGWSEVLESLRVCSWSNLLAWPHQSAGELAENDP